MRLSPAIALCALAVTAAADQRAAAAEFFRGVNINGPAATIRGRAWSAGDADWFATKDVPFEHQDVALTPSVDGDFARMIRSSVYAPDGRARLEIRDLPPGKYTVFLYVWEDNDSQTYDVRIDGRTALERVQSGAAGQWQKLGPLTVETDRGRIEIETQGGHANVSGVEIWKGTVTAEASDEPQLTDEELRFFEARIRPVLVERCYACHSVEHETAEGGLLLDTRVAMLKGGDRGPAVTPGDGEKSLLLRAIHHADPKLTMPPDEEPLTEEQIRDFETWIAGGAPDPRSGPFVDIAWAKELAQAREFWSFQPVRDPVPPEVNDVGWPRTPIDRFILARLEADGLHPVGSADRRTLIRRATFDLTGLPPTPAEIEAFLADPAPLQEAFAGVVDRLLASPRYGEQWGRHWMDLVRYADTAGDNSDFPVPQLYLYRNYVIDSFNADKPYDEFLCEQIAGDLLPADDPNQKNEGIVATGYVALARRFGSVVVDYPQHLTIEDTIDNLGRTVLGLTLSCARCHDHKFDPISQEDYYGLYGIFESTKYSFPGIELEQKPRDFVPLAETPTFAGELAYAVAEGTPADAKLHRRGDPKSLGDPVPRKFPDVLGGQRLPTEAASTSGRRQLAEWLTDPKNPLTARVMANRVWHYHFGSGLVNTPSDFGVRGQPPSHPELLDWLASRFVEEGWSIKRLHRLILLSRTYQLASNGEPANLARDPNDDLHWKFPRRRLAAESIRDCVLAVSDDLDPSMLREPHPFPLQDKWKYTQHHPFRDAFPSRRRSVYLMTPRLNVLPFFATFDGADANASTPDRDSSVTSVQALYLLNDEFVHDQAAKFARRLRDATADDAGRLELAFQLCLGRTPSDAEYASAAEHLRRVRDVLSSDGMPSDEADAAAWNSLARVMFRTNEFLYID